jgi:putative hydrolase of the HAD superfamily
MALDRVASTSAVVTLDALGTLVALEPPAPLLVAELRARGVRVSGREAAVALGAEIAYYRANHDMAADAPSLARLRARCTEVLRAALPAASALPAAELQAALLASLRFAPYDEVPAALRELRAAGHRLVVVSNWDVSLHDMLRTTGLRPLVDGAISSAEAGVPKPAPAIFARALALAGGAGGRALHAGDSVEHDVAGALAAGLEAVLVVRAGAPPDVPAGVRVVRSLAELARLAAA